MGAVGFWVVEREGCVLWFLCGSYNHLKARHESWMYHWCVYRRSSLVKQGLRSHRVLYDLDLSWVDHFWPTESLYSHKDRCDKGDWFFPVLDCKSESCCCFNNDWSSLVNDNKKLVALLPQWIRTVTVIPSNLDLLCSGKKSAGNKNLTSRLFQKI